MHAYLLVAAGGFIGAIARYAVSSYAAARSKSFYPLGTLFVNLLGSFLLGWIAAINNSTLSLLLGTGFMGAFTTFSTFKVEGLRLWMDSKYKVLLVYYAVSYTMGVFLAYSGYRIGLWLG
jgi:fluoride exporter